MEQRPKAKLTTEKIFVLEESEIRQLYTLLALFQYRHLRIPEYNERKLLERLAQDFKKFYADLQREMERDPNNLALYKVRGFFDTHYKKMRDLLDIECESSHTYI